MSTGWLMRSLLHRLRLLWHALRFGGRLIWLAAPREHRLHWAIALLRRLHASGHARARLHTLLPALGPLASAFLQSVDAHPELASATLHDALDAIGRLEAPLPPADVEAALSRALGRPAAALFARFDPVAVQSGLAEQTHLATLVEPVNGHREIAIKFVRVAQVQQIADELALLRPLARWLERLSGRARQLQLGALAEDLGDALLARFDLRVEAANLSQTGHHFDGDRRLVVPDVIWTLCTAHTLATQHVDTLPATDLAGLLVHHVRLAPLAAHLVEVVTEQAFAHGFFHASLDAAKVRVSVEPDTRGRLVLAQFAAMSSLSAQERAFFVHGASALFEQDYGRLARLHRDAGHVAHTTRTEALEAELRQRAEAHFAAAPDERSAGALFHHLLYAVEPFDGAVSSRLAIAQRTFEQAETLARTLHPGVDTWSVARGVLADLARRDLDHRGWSARIAQELPHLAQMLPRVPQLAVRYLQQQHDAPTARQRTLLLQDLDREYRRTRMLLWSCAICGGVLGAAAVLLTG
jgi:ubiquinone biosynthesis protein